MDILHARVVFRERSLLDVLDLALRFLVVHARVYALVGAAVLVPAVVTSLVAEWLWGWLVAWIFAVVASFAASIPFTVLASRLVFQDDAKVGPVLSSSLRDLPRVMFARFFWAIAFGASALFVAPAVWVGAAYFFIDEVIVLERAKTFASFVRSQRVASASFGDAFLAAFFLSLSVLGAVVLADFGGRAILGDLLQFRPPRALWAEGGSVLAMIGLFAIVPFASTARFFTYLNVRTRTEGWDIQTRFSAIAARAGGSSS